MELPQGFDIRYLVYSADQAKKLEEAVDKLPLKIDLDGDGAAKEGLGDIPGVFVSGIGDFA